MTIKTSNWLFGIIMVIIIIISILATSCEKPSDGVTQVVSDYDGNVYHTVMVNGQEWMVENLKVTHYNDGAEIPLVEDQNIWNNLHSINSGGYCYYDNNITNKDIYGCLYDWNSINTKKLAPVGWHVATNDDWMILINYLGGLDVAGGEMKSIGTKYWKSPNEKASDRYGLSVLPAGYRGGDSFYGLGETTSITGANLILMPDNTQQMLAVSAYSYQQRSNFGAAGFEVGLSVRCVKNVTFVNDGAK